MELIEQYKKDRLQLLPCPQVPVEPYAEYPENLDDDLVKGVIETAPPPIRQKLKSNRLHRYCIKMVLNGPEGIGKKTTARAIAQCLNHTCIILKAKRLQMPYQASAMCNLWDTLSPYIEYERNCVLAIDKADELSEMSADALRSFIKDRNHSKVLSFIFLTSKGYFGIPKPLHEFLGSNRCINIPYPAEETRKRIIAYYLRKNNFVANHQDEISQFLLKKTANFSPYDIKSFIDISISYAQKRDEQPVTLRNKDFDRAYIDKWFYDPVCRNRLIKSVVGSLSIGSIGLLGTYGMYRAAYGIIQKYL